MSLNWSDDAWRARAFGLAPRRLPLGYKSAAMETWQAENEREMQREGRLMADVQAHRRALADRERIERWAPLVDEYGSDVVEAICQHSDPAFRLPSALRDLSPSVEET